MNEPTPGQAFDELFEWCRARNFSGHDPFDALNSRVFQSLPVKHSRFARLAWTQINKRSPFNLRRLALVPHEPNSKGIALFALGAIANYRRLRSAESERSARELLEKLLELRIQGYSGAAWGYNFDWQSRNFFAPKGTPTIVPTAFAARALLEGFDVFKEQHYLDIARTTGHFICQDLNRTVDLPDEVCFSYSPMDHTRIFNGSLLAGETLARVSALTGDTELRALALRAANYVTGQQRPNGSWTYGAESSQSWIDSFHTAYILLSFNAIIKYTDERSDDFNTTLRNGFNFWRETFFVADGWPKYYHDALYPADAHAAATAIVTLIELGGLHSDALPLAEKIAAWTIRNLRDCEGFFYYQRRRFHTVRTPYMRWIQSWMLYALARLLEVTTS